MSDKEATSVRLTSECKRLLKKWAKQIGTSKTAIIELAVREYDQRKSQESK